MVNYHRPGHIYSVHSHTLKCCMHILHIQWRKLHNKVTLFTDWDLAHGWLKRERRTVTSLADNTASIVEMQFSYWCDTSSTIIQHYPLIMNSNFPSVYYAKAVDDGISTMILFSCTVTLLYLYDLVWYIKVSRNLMLVVVVEYLA